MNNSHSNLKKKTNNERHDKMEKLFEILDERKK